MERTGGADYAAKLIMLHGDGQVLNYPRLFRNLTEATYAFREHEADGACAIAFREAQPQANIEY